MNEMAYVLQAWLPLIVWQQVEAPQYQKGFITITFLSALLIVTAFVLRSLHHRQILEYVRPSITASLSDNFYRSKSRVELEEDSPDSGSADVPADSKQATSTWKDL